MIAHERKLHILEQLNQKGVISIKTIARELDISEATARRDFEKLEQSGKLKRVQGGAQLAGSGNMEFDAAELTMRQNKSLNYSAKEMIARHAAEYVRDGECVFIDGGTSLAPLIKQLSDRKIMIITNNHLNVHELVNPTAEIFLVGGIYLPHFGMCVGPVAESSLAQFNYDHAFIGCTGVDLEQQMTFTSDMAAMNIKNTAMSHADRSHLLIDDSKLQVRAFCRFRPLADFDDVICNVSERTDLNLEYPANFIMIDN